MITSIIVLNYQGQATLGETIDSLLKLNFNKTDFEILIPDNNSTDNSRQIIDSYTTKYPKLIKSLYLPKNIGFGAGNNEAIKIALGDYIVLLNNDCIVDKHWLTELVKTAKANQKIFSVTSKIKRYPQTLNQIQNAGSMVFQDGYSRDIGAIVTNDHQQLYEVDEGQYDTLQEVYSSCGAAVLYNKNKLDQIGYFNQNFFMYYEDTEISERARLAGYLNYYCPTATVFHHHAKSSGEWSPFFIYHVERGRLLHILFHFPISVFINEYLKFTIKAKLRFLRHPAKYIYLLVSLNIFLNFPRFIFSRFQFNKIYSPKNRQKEYNKILSGYWYFKK